METQESEFLTYDDVASVIERYGYTIDIMTTENHKVALCKAIGLVFSYNDITKEITRIDLNGKSIYRLKSSLSIETSLSIKQKYVPLLVPGTYDDVEEMLSTPETDTIMSEDIDQTAKQ